MDRRKGAKHNRVAAAIGSIRTRWHNGHRVRYIKVAHGGPPNVRWRPYARWLWERAHGPVPAGRRVIHRDGKTLNDSPDNLAAATPGDVVFLAHDRDAKMSERNFRKLRQATAKSNRLRGRINREMNWLPTRWYPVFVDRGFAVNDPHKSRAGVVRKYAGVDVPRNGRLMVALPFAVLRGREIAADLGPRLKKVDPETFEMGGERLPIWQAEGSAK